MAEPRVSHRKSGWEQPRCHRAVTALPRQTAALSPARPRRTHTALPGPRGPAGSTEAENSSSHPVPTPGPAADPEMAL